MKPIEIIFEITEASDGGYDARALGHSIFTQGENWSDLKSQVKDATLCHFDEADMPKIIRLHFVKDEAIAPWVAREYQTGEDMASFTGTKEEFHRYIGPRLRNIVQQITKKRKTENSVCKHCGAEGELEAAHVKGKERKDIIDRILKESTTGGICTVELGTFEDRFKEEHQPLDKSILLLCGACHRKYDSRSIPQPASANGESGVTARPYEGDYLPITLEPGNPRIFKTELLRTKRAEIEETYSDGRVRTKLWKAERFSETSDVMGNLRSRPEYRRSAWKQSGLIKVHVRVIKNP